MKKAPELPNRAVPAIIGLIFFTRNEQSNCVDGVAARDEEFLRR